MLLSLKVNNYALIEELHVEFHRGLNIITGETGAGKSILLGALGLILGKRADTTVLSNSEKKCVVEAEFNIEGYELEKLYIENDIDFDTHTVFRREILSSGKSRAFINDTPVNLSVLQDLALHLVDIHSQHQNLLLNQQSFLINIIDRCCRHENLVKNYSKVYLNFKLVKLDYEKALESYNIIKADIEYLSHQVNELTSANLEEGEIASIEQELSRLENSGEIKSALHESSKALSGEDQSVLDNLQAILGVLSKIQKVYPNATDLINRLESARIELKELNSDLLTAFDKLDFDPKQYEKQKSRLDLLYSLLQKYRVGNEVELLETLNYLNQKLSVGIDGEFELNKQFKQVQKLEAEAHELATVISKNRIKSFESIQIQVESVLKNLGIEYSKLQIERTKQEMSPNGIDVLTFMFSANKNHPLQDVSKIASGGELSRLMLSIKTLLSTTNGMPTIILDEIDTGVSGEIADKVGNIIRSMSAGMQVVNITHLPQVASKAEAHFKVYKDHANEQTKTLIKKLNDPERLEEIAKMLSGEELSDAAIENARVLLGR
jgi:DNA repair protein RecN (Recombination protein N)